MTSPEERLVLAVEKQSAERLAFYAALESGRLNEYKGEYVLTHNSKVIDHSRNIFTLRRNLPTMHEVPYFVAKV